MATDTRAYLHTLVDALPDASVAPVTAYVRRAMDPMTATLDASPLDDEPITAEDDAAIAAAEAAFEQGEFVTLDSLRAELGAG